MKLFAIIFITAIVLLSLGCEERKSSEISSIELIAEETLELSDLRDDTILPLSVVNKRLFFHDTDQPYTLIHFFTPKHASVLPYLTTLQKEHGKKVFVASILLENDLNSEAFEAFKQANHTAHFIAYGYDNLLAHKLFLKTFKELEGSSLPLSVLLKNGEYFMSYEGEAPVEMILHDIKR